MEDLLGQECKSSRTYVRQEDKGSMAISWKQKQDTWNSVHKLANPSLSTMRTIVTWEPLARGGVGWLYTWVRVGLVDQLGWHMNMAMRLRS